MLITHQFVTEPHTCAYLPDRQAALEYSLAPDLSAEEYEELMNSGFRKFGIAFFQPLCMGCRACRPIRFEARALKLSRSQKRTLKLNEDLEVIIQPPNLDDQRMALYRRYHAHQRCARDWPLQNDTRVDYKASFIENSVPSLEITLWERDTLRGVMLTELTPRVVSAVYHYYDPGERDRGLGTMMILQCAELALQTGRRWVYLGYYVEGSPSMAYKKKFRPCELMGVDGVWRTLT